MPSFPISSLKLMLSVFSWMKLSVCGVKQCEWLDNYHRVEYTCPDDEYCCGSQECCEYSVEVNQDIVDLWYFWLCIGFAIIICCAVSGFACGKRYRKRKKKKKKRNKHHVHHVIHTTAHVPAQHGPSEPDLPHPPPHYAPTRSHGMMTTGHDPYGPGSSIGLAPVGTPGYGDPTYSEPGESLGAAGAMALSPAYSGRCYDIPAPPGFHQSKEVAH